MPKAKFPEYAVFIPNIMPVCSICNGKKSSKFIDHEMERQFFNVYFDRVPITRILKAKIMFSDSIPIAKFYLLDKELKEKLPEKEIKVIKNHFQNLDLLKRYEKASTDVIYEKITVIKCMMLQMNQHEIKNFCKNYIRQNDKIYGINYWKNVLEQAILEEQFDEFYSFCKENYK